MSVFFWAFCEDCGDEVELCHLCQKSTARSLSESCTDCEENPYEALSKKALYLCSTCTETRRQASSEIWSYWYSPVDTTKPLSPTNVYRVPRFRKVGEGVTDPVKRADEARVAYEEELRFSGSEEEALKIYVSFYNRGGPRDPKTQIREGFVSKREILAGQTVTAEQFFASLQMDPEDFGDSEPPIGNTPKTMSKRELQLAIQEAKLDLEHTFSTLRTREPTQQDVNTLLGYYAWTGRLWTELRSR
jgi:hypothetical protein